MTDETLTLWGNGAVTLPKGWREQYDTRHFLARENAQGYLVIMPILDIAYHEEKNGTHGLRFPMGIASGDLLRIMKEVDKKVQSAEKSKKKNSGKRSRRK
jgi:hypothetical protein